MIKEQWLKIFFYFLQALFIFRFVRKFFSNCQTHQKHANMKAPEDLEVGTILF